MSVMDLFAASVRMLAPVFVPIGIGLVVVCGMFIVLESKRVVTEWINSLPQCW